VNQPAGSQWTTPDRSGEGEHYLEQAVVGVCARPPGQLTLLVLLTLLMTGPTAAQDTTSAAGFAARVDLHDIEPFFDTLAESHLARLHSPGMVISVVQGDSVVLVKGYGHADLEGTIPMDGERHLFRVASITKVFTATAIMQLVEAGEIDLAADVNRYLTAFQLDDPFGEPSTIRQLMQHTSGIDDDYVDILLESPDQHWPLVDYFTRHVPTRVRRPGRVMVYTNRAYMLLGHVVEAVSGMDYEDYIHDRILQPLGMSRSYLELPDSVAADRARGSEFRDGKLVDVYVPDTNTRPSSDLLTTARDMTGFMRAFLNEGASVGGGRILRPETVSRMYTDCFRYHPLHDHGRCFGWGYSTVEGIPVWTHGGNHPGYKSMLTLIPSHDISLFWSYSSESGGLHPLLVQAFFERYLGDDGAPGESGEAPGTGAGGARTLRGPVPDEPPPRSYQSAVPGRYRTLRAYQSLATLEKFLILLANPEVVVSVASDGSVQIAERSFEPVVPERSDGPAFRDFESGRILAFFEDPIDGRTYVSVGGQSFRKLSWYEFNVSQLGILGLLMLVLAGSLLLRGTQSFRRKRGSLVGDALGVRPRWADWSITVAAVLWLIAVVGFLVTGPTEPGQFVFGLSGRVRFFLTVVRVAALGTTVAAITLVLAWQDASWNLRGRRQATVALAAAAATIPWMLSWHVL